MKTIGLNILLLLSFFFASSHIFSQNAQNTRKAPLYWSIYEYAWVAEQSGNTNIDMSEEEWDRVIDWVAENLLPYGYDMICTDGFIGMHATDESGYMTQYGSMNLKKLVAKCRAKGLRLGIYDNPLWLHGPDHTIVEGTNVTFGSLRYSEADRNTVLYPNAGDVFGWVVPSHKGAKEYIDGFFKHFKNLGVDFIRMDFLSLFETASGAGGMPGRGYGRANYELALKYISEAAQKYGVFTSLVMPNMFNDAEFEKKYGNMVRIVADTFWGGWDHVSDRLRGNFYDGWPNCHNQFDGFINWSHIGGRGKVILDGDFIRLNTLGNDNEKRTSISLQLMAGGPISVADQHNTIKSGDLKFYQNRELLALNADGFVGKPLSTNMHDPKSQIWTGQMSNGDWIVGLFNREGSTQKRRVDFKTDLGITGNAAIRDLWDHYAWSYSGLEEDVPAHGCKIYRIKAPAQAHVYAAGTFNNWDLPSLPMTLSDGNNWHTAPVYLAAGDYSMKFANTADWSGADWGDAAGLAGTAKVATGHDQFLTFSIAKAGNYTLHFNDVTLAYSIHRTMYVGGSFNEWNLSKLPMRLSDEDNWHTEPVYLAAGNYEMKFANAVDWSGGDWGDAAGASGTAKVSTGKEEASVKFQLSQSDYYIFRFNERTLAYTVIPQKIYVAGSFNGWDLLNLPMSRSDGDNWQSDYIYLEKGRHSLKFANTADWSGDDWGDTYGLAGIARLSTGDQPAVTFDAPQAGYYIFRFNNATLHYSIERQKMYIGGTFNDWKPANLPMTFSDPHNCSAFVYLKAGDHVMKFANTSNWSGDDWGGFHGFSGTAQKSTDKNIFITFNVSKAGYHQIHFNDATLAYSIERIVSMYAAGTFTGWDLSRLPMIQVDNANWRTEPVVINAGNHEMKFANTPNWSGDDWGNATGLSGTAKKTTGGGSNIKFNLSQSGDYVFKFNDATLAYSIEAHLLATTNNVDAKSIDVHYLKTSKKIIIEKNHAGDCRIEIFGVNGQRIFTKQSSKHQIVIDTSAWNDQIVIVQTNSSAEVYRFKIVL